MAKETTKATEVEATVSESAEEKTPVVAEPKKKTKKVFMRKPEGTTAKAHVVGLNGVMYTIPYNKETEVPLGVARIVERSQRYAEKAEAERERIASKITG